jgi:hypothetical protein
MMPLTELTGLKSNKLFHKRLHKAQVLAFKAVKAVITREVLLTCPDPNEQFNIENEPSDYQLSAVIKQHGRPVAFFSRKLTRAQRNYTTIQKELLSIVETLTTVRPILLGSQLHIFKFGLTMQILIIPPTLRRSKCSVVICILKNTEYGPTIHWKAGKENNEADKLSRYPCLKRGSVIDEHQAALR